MTFLEAALLGAVQGIFMFVPVSSTAHLVLTQHFLIAYGSNLPAPDSGEMILFNLIVHVGTLVSVVVVFRRSLLAFLAGTLAALRTMARKQAITPAAEFVLRLWALALIAVFVTGVVGLAFKDLFTGVFGAPAIIPLTLSITGALLWWTDRLKPRRWGIRDIGLGTALVVGLAQGLALIPGLSRSGMTIIAALFCGLKRRRAAEFSFLIAFPTILAATAVQGLQLARGGEPMTLAWGPILVAFAVSAIVGIYALRLVLVLLYRSRLKVFSIYLWTLAALVAFGVLDFSP